MKKLFLVLAGMFFLTFAVDAQHVDGNDGKTYYDAAKTKLKEVYNYKEVNVFSATGDRSIVETKKKKHGPYFYYYESGKIKISGNYKDDEKHGNWKYYDERGRLVKTEVYEKGKKVKSGTP